MMISLAFLVRVMTLARCLPFTLQRLGYAWTRATSVARVFPFPSGLGNRATPAVGAFGAGRWGARKVRTPQSRVAGNARPP